VRNGDGPVRDEERGARELPAGDAGTPVSPDGSRRMADGMAETFRSGEVRHNNQVAANDAGAAYDEMVQRNSEAWKQPIRRPTN